VSIHQLATNRAYAAPVTANIVAVTANNVAIIIAIIIAVAIANIAAIVIAHIVAIVIANVVAGIIVILVSDIVNRIHTLSIHTINAQVHHLLPSRNESSREFQSLHCPVRQQCVDSHLRFDGPWYFHTV
jgi:hypothetical protein